MNLSFSQMIAVVCIIAIGFLLMSPLLQESDAQVSQECLEAMIVESDAYEWVMYACWMAFYDDSWDSECVNANIALATAISYREAVCS